MPGKDLMAAAISWASIDYIPDNVGCVLTGSAFISLPNQTLDASDMSLAVAVVVS
jgi:hypothetical protein